MRCEYIVAWKWDGVERSEQCRRNAMPGVEFCWQHDGPWQRPKNPEARAFAEALSPERGSDE